MVFAVNQRSAKARISCREQRIRAWPTVPPHYCLERTEGEGARRNRVLPPYRPFLRGQSYRLHVLLLRFDFPKFLRNAANNLATNPTRPRSDFGLLSVEHIHPAQGLSLADPAQVHLRGLEVLVPEDYFGDDFKRNPVPTRVGG